MKTVEIHLSLTEVQAVELAQFLKRVAFSEYRNNAIDEASAYHIRDAGEVIRRTLAKQGYAPQ